MGFDSAALLSTGTNIRVETHRIVFVFCSLNNNWQKIFIHGHLLFIQLNDIAQNIMYTFFAYLNLLLFMADLNGFTIIHIQLKTRLL